MNVDAIVAELRSMAGPLDVAGLARFGIRSNNILGVSVVPLRALAKRIGRSHELAAQLWKTGIHEARIIASFIDDPAVVSEAQMNSWAADFDTWAVCDACCLNLFDKTPFAYAKAIEWSRREEEYVKRGGFALMAALAVHDKAASDTKFRAFFPAIEAASGDERNFVKKAVNWALRQLGKRNPRSNTQAIQVALRIQKKGARSGRWIAANALRELRGEAVRRRLGMVDEPGY